jgi:hypothetical protein
MTNRERAKADIPTADRMRHDISRGAAGDKVDHPDPAAAPLGTDDEAAGRPPSLNELRIAAQTSHSKPSEKRIWGVVIFYVAVVSAMIAVIVITAVSLR